MGLNYQRKKNNEPPTLCISNGGQSAINETNMNKQTAVL